MKHTNHISPRLISGGRDKLGEDYMFNKQVPFASVPDSGLFMLQSHGVQYTFNEMLAIQTHDGLYDDANKKYLICISCQNKNHVLLSHISFIKQI